MSNGKKGVIRSITRFFKETRSEIKKVVWPDRKELMSYTSIVFVSVALAAFFIWVVDIAFGRILGLIIR